MEIDKLRKEITQLIDNIKEHSDYLSDFESIPQVEMEMILLKIKKLHEKAIIFSHEFEQEMLVRRVKKNPEPVTEPPSGLPGQHIGNEGKVLVPKEPPVEERLGYRQSPKPKIIETPDISVAPIPTIEELQLEEDKPEKKIVAESPKEGNLVEDRPEEKLVKEEPGAHIHEKPVGTEEQAMGKKEDERGLKGELHERLKNDAKTGSINERIGQSKIYSSLSNKLQMNPISDLKKSIGINEKFLYTKEMFKNNASDFSEALDKLNSFGNYAEAEHYVFVELAPKYNWDKTSDTFYKFMELVQRRYL